MVRHYFNKNKAVNTTFHLLPSLLTDTKLITLLADNLLKVFNDTYSNTIYAYFEQWTCITDFSGIFMPKQEETSNMCSVLAE